MRRPVRGFFGAALVVGATIAVIAPSSGAPASTNPIGRAAVLAGYQVLHELPVLPGANRVTTIPRGLMVVAGGQPRASGPTEITDLKMFFRVTNGVGLSSWLDGRHSSRLAEYVEGAHSRSDGRGRISSYSLWSVVGASTVMQVAYNANDVTSGSAYMRVDVFVYWSPEFMAISNVTDRISLSVTDWIVTGKKTVHESPSGGLQGDTCTIVTYRKERKPLATLTGPPLRIAGLVHYINTRAEVTGSNAFVVGFVTPCEERQVPPPRATYSLSFYRAGSSAPVARIDGVVQAIERYSVTGAWSRSGSGGLVAKALLRGVSLAFLETYLSGGAHSAK